MVREPPPWRNDAALLSKIASQEKLRAELPSPFLPCPPSLLVPEHPLPERTTAWFLLQESIRWLQESKRFYVKILQKIMARYTFLQRGIALHSLSSRFIPLFSFFLTSSSVFRLDITLPFFSSSLHVCLRVLRPNYYAPRVHPSNCISISIGSDWREEIGRKEIHPRER